MRECFEYIYRRVNENSLMSEDELYEVLINSKFFRKLGYKKFGKDVRAQLVVPGKRKKADYVCRDEYQNAIFVLEAKRPSHRTLSDALTQLWNRYVLPLKARYGVLTNGWKIVVYKKIGENPERVLTVDLSKISKKQCDELFRILKKPEYDITLYSRVEEYFSSVEKLSLKTELAKEDFFETFKLGEDSVFGSLLASLVELFDFVYPKSKFLKGAYGFWQKSLARKPKKIPDSWAPFLKENRDVFRFMFCLESAHALLARLIIAKACEDLNFPGISVSDFTLGKIHQVRGQIPIVAYPLVLISVIKEMRDQLVYSLFEDDIFGWWRDGFTEFMQKSSSELLRKSVDKRLEDFSNAVAKVIFMLYKFDFGEVAGDPLGDLYQQYFDRDTRKALGEFYTPVEVVNYILDAVGYENIGYRRLLDPACGSGTFVVEALKRYLMEAKRKAKRHGWAYVLRELCNSPKIVGFDIHPFACLIARTRFMLELIPYFKKALEEAPHMFYLKRIPIFRTDSLAVEMIPPEFQRQRELAETKEDIAFPVIIPMKIDSESSIFISISLPSWRRILAHELPLYNLDEYFCTLQAIFDAIKVQLREKGTHVPENALLGPFREYLKDKDFLLLAKFFKPYADRILSEIKRIQSEFEDGRLIKSIEDAVLASLLKNYLQYDFVVGNPPYIRIESIPEKMRDHYQKLYESAVYRFDIYMLFIERGIQWLRKGGMFGFIISNMFTKRDSGRALRKLILSNSAITQFLDFGDSGVFADVTNYPSILILEKGKVKRNEVKVVRVKQQKEDILQEIAKKISLGQYSGDYYDIFLTEQESLNSKQWKFMPKNERVIMEKMENASVRLKNVAYVRRGLITGANDVFIIKDKNDFEENLLKPIIGGSNIQRWKIDWDGSLIIYPHKSRQISVNITLFPKIYEYLTSHRSKLEQRYCVKRQNPRKWYELHDAGEPDWFEKPKIVVCGISNRNEFAIDEPGNFYYLDSSFFLIQRDNSEIDFKYLLGLLNSTPLEFYFKHVASVKRGKYYEYRSQYLDVLPIKMPKTHLEKKIEPKIAEKVERILQYLKSERFIKGFPDTYLGEYRSKGVEFDGVRFIFTMDHNKLKPVLSGFPGKGFSVFPAEDEDSVWVDTKEKAQYLILALRSRRVNQNDTIKILIPRDNSIVTEILEKVKKTVEGIKATPIDQLENEINELVYQLYDLNEDDKAVIEDFLKKF